MASRRYKSSNVIVAEEFRIKTENILRGFIFNENMMNYEFPSTLTNNERAWIHDFIKHYGLTSKSHGKEPNRKLTISKPKGTTNKDIATVTLCQESKQYIESFLCQFPGNKEKAEMNQLQTRFKNYESPDINMGQLTYGYAQLPAFGLNKDLIRFRMSLPIWPMREHIIEQIISNQVIIIRGETGSGKTTQIPQFILDYHASCREKCRVICTQPRRISAVSVAERVAAERGENSGQSVGFHIRLESCVGPKTSLIYCTNGILLRTLMSGDVCLNNYTHIIVDEIHERDRFSDFLLICLRECLVNYSHLRLILMSATIDVTTFSNYFNNAPVIHVPGRLHNVCSYYLDEILTLLQYESNTMKAAKANLPLRTKNKVARNFTEQLVPVTNSDLQAELDDCINECFEKGSADYFNLFLQYILNDQISVNYRHSESGYTALMAAAAHGSMDLCMTLLQFGANAKLRSSHENLSAADWAFAKQHIHLAELLKQCEMNSLNNEVANKTNLLDVDDAKLKLDLYHRTVSDQTIDYDLLHNLLYYVHYSNGPGSILVFLAGYDDIVTVREKILCDARFRVYPFEICILHGMMQISDQHKVFNPMKGKRKIILSTNIAETSITIDDVVYVIDCGKVKEKTYDALTGICSLQCFWISQSAAKQRAGRAGRTQNGFSFHLFSRNRYESMQKFATPEMLRMPLHELCLQTKMLAPRETKVADFLCRALEPPSSMAVRNAIKHLQDLGALDEDENLTILGQHLVDLPVEPRLAKMLIYAVIFKCVDPILTIVAFLGYRDPFVMPNTLQEKNIAMMLKKQFSMNTFSDHMILLQSFNAWQKARLDSEERLFCNKNFLNAATMEMVVKIRSQLLAQLRAAGFVNTKPPGDIRELNENSNNWAMIKGILTAGFYPNIGYINKDSMKISTRKEKKVSLHTSSALRSNERPNNIADTVQSLKKIPTNWLIYEELSRNNNNHNIRSVTCVTPVTVALFVNDTETQPDLTEETDSDEESTPSSSNNWVRFQGSPDVLNMIAEIRHRLNYLITKKITNPHRVLTTQDTYLLQTIMAVMQAEDEVHGLHQPVGIGQRPKVMNCSGDVNSDGSIKNHRYSQHQVVRTQKEEEYFSQFLGFKRVTPLYYNKYIPQPLIINNEEDSQSLAVAEDLDSSDPVQNLRQKLEEINMENVLDLQQDEPFDFMTFPGQKNEEACALQSSYGGALWKQHVTNPEWTIFCIIKTGSFQSIEVSIGKKVWIFPPYIEKKLKMLFETGKNIILVFTVHNSQYFQAIARLVKMPEVEDANFCIQSSLEWFSRADVSFLQVREFFPDQYNDGDQLIHKFGVRLWQLFTECVPQHIQYQLEPNVGLAVNGRPITKKPF